jgi:hypothetical protein
MSNFVHGFIARTNERFPIALVAVGFIASIVWTSTVMTFAFERIWSLVPGL